MSWPRRVIFAYSTGESLTYRDPLGREWSPGETIPLLRLDDATLINEPVILAHCDECDWSVIAPASIAWAKSYAHHTIHDMEDQVLFDDTESDDDASDFIP